MARREEGIEYLRVMFGGGGSSVSVALPLPPPLADNWLAGLSGRGVGAAAPDLFHSC